MKQFNMDQNAETISCAYESNHLNQALDEVLHPGGLQLTKRMTKLVQVKPGQLILDLASGRGSSTRFLAEHFNCKVIGVDLSRKSILIANRRANNDDLLQKVYFSAAYAENLPMKSGIFDVVISECSFSLLNKKTACAREINRILKPKGILALNDITRQEHPEQQISENKPGSCFTGAETVDNYTNIFEQAGFDLKSYEDHTADLKKITWKIIQAYGSLANYWKSHGFNRTPSTGMSDKLNRSSGIPNSGCAQFPMIKPGYAIFVFEKKDKKF